MNLDGGYKSILIEYFKEKKSARPSDMEDDLLGGGGGLIGSIMGNSNFHSSPFMKPFNELIQEGKIEYQKDENGWLYSWK